MNLVLKVGWLVYMYAETQIPRDFTLRLIHLMIFTCFFYHLNNTVHSFNLYWGILYAIFKHIALYCIVL